MDNNPNNIQNHKPTRNPNNLFNILIIGIVLTFILNMLFGNLMSNSKTQITYSQFVKLVDSGTVSSVQLSIDEILINLKKNMDTSTIDTVKNILVSENTDNNLNSDQIDSALKSNNVFYTGLVDDPDRTQRLLNNNVSFYQPITRSSPILDFIASWVIPIVIMYILYMLLFRSIGKRLGNMEGGGLNNFMGVGKSSAKLYDMEKNTGITFKDVAGEDEAKESLDEIVDFLHNPEKYQEIGAKQPKGALLVGPPGTGKTLLAKAVAGEAHVPFFSLSGSEFVEMFVGVGASRVRDLFKQAGKQAPCIIFIDEIDAIGKSRDNQFGNDEREQTLNQLLAEMDGFDTSKGIVVLAATNRPDSLDKALLRPGRFDRRIIVERPDLPGREAILKVHAKKVKMDSTCNLREIALVTSGASGADLANMINEAALRAVRMNRKVVKQEDLMEAVEVVIAGKEKKDRIMTEKEKLRVAFHEVGHALVTALQKDGQPVQKITIVPRTMGTLGYTMSMPEEERYLNTKDELLAQITTYMGGRAAEEIEFNQPSDGAYGDIEEATKIARRMVTQFGMSEKFDMVSLESIHNQYLDGRPVTNYSETTGAAIDEEVRNIIKKCHEKALSLLEEHHLKLQEIAKFLYEKETITGAEFMDILSR
ncbi:MAG: ATP-dependent zinc metalloprotease FtsH [Oscillospiraceae bacterium]|nr:ATP-dependent zinc metalloprotease FtsH [Oscillospiraceae bacterium]